MRPRRRRRRWGWKRHRDVCDARVTLESKADDLAAPQGEAVSVVRTECTEVRIAPCGVYKCDAAGEPIFADAVIGTCA